MARTLSLDEAIVRLAAERIIRRVRRLAPASQELVFWRSEVEPLILDDENQPAWRRFKDYGRIFRNKRRRKKHGKRR